MSQNPSVTKRNRKPTRHAQSHDSRALRPIATTAFRDAARARGTDGYQRCGYELSFGLRSKRITAIQRLFRNAGSVGMASELQHVFPAVG